MGKQKPESKPVKLSIKEFQQTLRHMLSSFKIPRSKKHLKDLEKSKLLLFEELKEAKRDWINAGNKLDYVHEHDQVDYAIYALEAAERRYEMLLRKAKQLNLRAEHPDMNVFSEELPIRQVLER